jgi:hypothetical protein
MKTHEIESKIKKLPDQAIQEINDYLDFLLDKYKQTKVRKKRFKFDWEGGLIKLKGEFTSVELQHKASEWR